MFEFEEILSKIEKYENSIKANITTNSTVMNLKTQKINDYEKELEDSFVNGEKTVDEIIKNIKNWKDKKKEIEVFLQTGGKTFDEIAPMFKSCEELEEKIKGDLNTKNKSFEEIVSSFELLDTMKKNLEEAKSIIDFEYVENSFKSLNQMQARLIKQYKEVESQKKAILSENNNDNEITKFMINQLDEDAVRILNNIDNLISHYKKLDEMSSEKEVKTLTGPVEEIKKESEEEVNSISNDSSKETSFEQEEKKETKFISNDPEKIKEKIKTVEENIGGKLNATHKPSTEIFKLKKGPATFDEFAEQGGTEPEPNGLLRRVVKSIKNKWDEWRKKDTNSQITENEMSDIIGLNPEVDSIYEVPAPEVNEVPALEPVQKPITNEDIANITGINQPEEIKEMPISQATQVPMEEPIKPEVNQPQGITNEEIYRIINEASNNQMPQYEEEMPNPYYGHYGNMSMDDIYNPLRSKY